MGRFNFADDGDGTRNRRSFEELAEALQSGQRRRYRVNRVIEVNFECSNKRGNGK